MINENLVYLIVSLKVQSFDMNTSLTTRAFNYETRPTVTCKHLPWVGDGSNAEVKRNVNCDLYEKKGKTRVWRCTDQRVGAGGAWLFAFLLKSTSGSASWVKEKTTEGKSSPQKADSPANSGGPSFLTITGETYLPLMRAFHTVFGHSALHSSTLDLKWKNGLNSSYSALMNFEGTHIHFLWTVKDL